MEIDISKLDKSITLSDFINYCNIPGIGPETSKKIAEKVKNIVTFRNLIEEEQINVVLSEVSGLGDRGIGNIIKSLTDVDFMIALDDLEELDFELFKDDTIYELDTLLETKLKKEPSKVLSGSFDINGLNICITGTLSMPRRFFENSILKKGGIFQSTVNKKTNVLVYSSKDGIHTTKYNTALNIIKYDPTAIKLMTEEEFVKSTDIMI